MNTNNKGLYDAIEIPKTLDQMINNTIEDVREESMLIQRKKKHQWLIAAVLMLGLFIVPLNTSQSFAQAVSEIPVLGVVANLLTFRSYDFETETVVGEVSIPSIVGMEDEAYQENLNSVISERVEEALKASKERAEEYKEAYIETGGTEEEYASRKIEVAVDYKIFSNQDNRLSFLVFSHESLAAVYATYAYYNIDLLNNEAIELETLLGASYQEIITEAVLKQTKAQKELGEIMFFDDIDASDWMVRRDIDFYINEVGNVVVVFNKYEIAAGANGRLEYEIE